LLILQKVQVGTHRKWPGNVAADYQLILYLKLSEKLEFCVLKFSKN
jgi:hypothetical protein